MPYFPRSRRARIAVGAAMAVTAGAAMLFMHPRGPSTYLATLVRMTPELRSGTCVNLSLDSSIGTPLDATADGGAALWSIALGGQATGAVTIRIYDGAVVAPPLAEVIHPAAGPWNTTVPLSLGWHRLTIRAIAGTRTHDQVYWLGLGETGPTWTGPGPWESGNDAGVVCTPDAGCFRPGVVPRCSGGPFTPADGGGILDALSDAWGDPIGCVRGCGTLHHIKDGGCSDSRACPGLVDSGLYYRPHCCADEPNSKGWRYGEPWAASGIVGLAGDIAAQPTSGSKLTIVSSSTADIGDSVTIYGTDTAGFARQEQLTTDAATGTTPVVGIASWATVAGVGLNSEIVGTLTITSTTGGHTVMTVTTAAPTKGLRVLSNNRGNVINSQRVTFVADAATTAQIVVVDVSGKSDGVTLNGTSGVETLETYNEVTLLALGTLDATRSLSLSATAGWCAESKAGKYSTQARGDLLLKLNFAGVQDTGCGTGHLLVSLIEAEKEWPPPPGDAGAYSHDAYLASRYRKYDYTCRVRNPGTVGYPVDYNKDVGVNGVPFCLDNWCCVLSKIYPTPDSGP